MSERYLVDTSVLVPFISPRHHHHATARTYLVDRIATGDAMVVPAHSLVETYSVVTRMPLAMRLSPAAAGSLLEGVIAAAEVVVGLTARQYVDLVQALPTRGVAGGAVYDALIIETAIAAGVDEVVTFNVRDFVRLARGRIRVTRPAPR